MNKTKVLFICTHNAARSQMAEAFLRKYAGDHFDVYSAGFAPQPIHLLTFEVMKEIGIDISSQRPKDLWQLVRNEYFGIAITVCKKGEEEDCPTISGTSTRIYWNVEDPAAFEGTEEEKLTKFREVRDQIDTKTKDWLKERGIEIKK